MRVYPEGSFENIFGTYCPVGSERVKIKTLKSEN